MHAAGSRFLHPLLQVITPLRRASRSASAPRVRAAALRCLAARPVLSSGQARNALTLSSLCYPARACRRNTDSLLRAGFGFQARPTRAPVLRSLPACAVSNCNGFPAACLLRAATRARLAASRLAAGRASSAACELSRARLAALALYATCRIRRLTPAALQPPFRSVCATRRCGLAAQRARGARERERPEERSRAEVSPCERSGSRRLPCHV